MGLEKLLCFWKYFNIKNDKNKKIMEEYLDELIPEAKELDEDQIKELIKKYKDKTKS